MFDKSVENLTKETEALSGVSELCKMETGGNYYKISFPASDNSDYYFEAYIYEDGEPQIAAQLKNALADTYFWYMPFELAAFNTVDHSHEEFLKYLKLVLFNPTRITASKGMLLFSFVCEYNDGKSWETVGGISCFYRFSKFIIPIFDGKKKIYYSDTILSS